MKKILIFASLVLALAVAPQEARAEGFSGDFSIIGGEITEEQPAAPSTPDTKEEEVVTPSTPSTEEKKEPAAPSTPDTKGEEAVTPSTPAGKTVLSEDSVEEVPLAKYVAGEVVTIEDEPTPGEGYAPDVVATDEDNDAAEAANSPIAYILAGLLALLFFFILLKRAYVVEVEEDGAFKALVKFYRLSKAAEFLKEQECSRIRVCNTWRRDNICTVYKFVDGVESCDSATTREAKVLKEVLGFTVPEEVLL